MRKLLATLLLALPLVACGTATPPTEPIPWQDPPALLEDESRYISYTATATVPMEPNELRDYLKESGSLIKYMEPVGSIAPPKDSIALRGEWPDKGARRILIQVDDHQILERSLKNDVDDFRYQAFGFTGEAARGVDHIYADWSLTPVEGGTRFDWTYRFASKNFIARRVITGLRDEELAPFMQGTMDRMAEAVNDEVMQRP